jgi:hypothetical protein
MLKYKIGMVFNNCFEGNNPSHMTYFFSDHIIITLEGKVSRHVLHTKKSIFALFMQLRINTRNNTLHFDYKGNKYLWNVNYQVRNFNNANICD